MFTIEMLPADYGDCLWIEYGDPVAPQRILIDGGTLPTFKFLKQRILKLPEAQRRFELLVITHLDNDHIETAVKLLNAKSPLAQFGEVAAAETKSLLGRYRLLDSLVSKLAAMKEQVEKTLAEKSPLEQYKDLEKDLRERWEKELAAAIEAERYLAAKNV